MRTPFLHKVALDPAFIPLEMPHRERQINHIYRLLQDKRNSNIYGEVGTGKTVSILFALGALRTEYFHADCKEQKEREFLMDLGRFLRINVKKSMYISELYEVLKIKINGVIVFLDNADHLSTINNCLRFLSENNAIIITESRKPLSIC